jgi:hypothetical protein
LHTVQTLRQDWDEIARQAQRKMAAARASMEEKRGLTSDREEDDDDIDDDEEAGKTEKNSIYQPAGKGDNS